MIIKRNKTPQDRTNKNTSKEYKRDLSNIQKNEEKNYLIDDIRPNSFKE